MFFIADPRIERRVEIIESLTKYFSENYTEEEVNLYFNKDQNITFPNVKTKEGEIEFEKAVLYFLHKIFSSIEIKLASTYEIKYCNSLNFTAERFLSILINNYIKKNSNQKEYKVFKLEFELNGIKKEEFPVLLIGEDSPVIFKLANKRISEELENINEEGLEKLKPGYIFSHSPKTVVRLKDSKIIEIRNVYIDALNDICNLMIKELYKAIGESNLRSRKKPLDINGLLKEYGKMIIEDLHAKLLAHILLKNITYKKMENRDEPVDKVFYEMHHKILIKEYGVWQSIIISKAPHNFLMTIMEKFDSKDEDLPNEFYRCVNTRIVNHSKDFPGIKEIPDYMVKFVLLLKTNNLNENFIHNVNKNIFTEKYLYLYDKIVEDINKDSLEIIIKKHHDLCSVLITNNDYSIYKNRFTSIVYLLNQLINFTNKYKDLDDTVKQKINDYLFYIFKPVMIKYNNE